MQVVEYCEGSGCRRKKILESFGEQVQSSTTFGCLMCVSKLKVKLKVMH